MEYTNLLEGPFDGLEVLVWPIGTAKQFIDQNDTSHFYRNDVGLHAPYLGTDTPDITIDPEPIYLDIEG